MVNYVFGTSFLRALSFLKHRERIKRHSAPFTYKTGNLKQKPCKLPYSTTASLVLSILTHN